MTDTNSDPDKKVENRRQEGYKHLIMEGPDFEVVMDNEGDIDWTTEDSYNWEKIDPKDVIRFNPLVNRASELEIICNSSDILRKYKRTIAESLRELWIAI
jgi:hypothetical protein